MSVLDLKHSSCQADEGCIVFCRSHANILLGSQETKLFRITTKADKVHYVWCEAPDGYEYEFPAVCRAFAEKEDLLEDDIFAIKTKQEIIPNEDVFCFGGYVYYLRGKPNGNLVIRRICAYSSQKIVEQIIAEDFHDIVAESFFLVNFHLLENNRLKYVMTCWGVVYQGGFLYMPIFDEERHLIYDYPVESYIKSEIPVGTVFKCNECNEKMYYQTAIDEHGKFYLNYSRSPFLFNRDKKSAEREGHAQIVKMTIKKESNGV